MAFDINHWLNDHLILHDILVILATSILTWLFKSIKRTVRRLVSNPRESWSVRLLRARLLGAEAYLEDFYRLRDSLRYFILRCTQAVLYAIAAGTVIIVIAVEDGKFNTQAPHSLLALVAGLWHWALVSILINLCAQNIVKIINTSLDAENRYKARINRLKVRLLEKGVS
jgi:hypothetical protein